MFSEEQDRLIIEAYTPPYRPGRIRQLCQQWQCRHYQLRSRALALGCKLIKGGIKKSLWSKNEVALLLEYPHLTSVQLHQVFLRKGYHRSKHAIDIRRRRLGWLNQIERDPDEVGYRAADVARLLGVDHTTVSRWVRQKLLPVHRHPGEINPRVSRQQLREFMIHHLGRWEPGDVDKYWLIPFLIDS